MKHKWAKEIKAWADGAEIEHRFSNRDKKDEWDLIDDDHDWSLDCFEYRIKPQPKPDVYLYVYQDEFGEYFLDIEKRSREFRMKIKLEQDDE